MHRNKIANVIKNVMLAYYRQYKSLSSVRGRSLSLPTFTTPTPTLRLYILHLLHASKLDFQFHKLAL